MTERGKRFLRGFCAVFSAVSAVSQCAPDMTAMLPGL
jgi:hypothetical protein